jgi:ABC-type polysaccharide/polyol phosphate export permease
VVSTTGSAQEWRENAARPGPASSAWLSLWQSKDLIALLARRDLRLRYNQAALGVVWVLIQPIVSVAIFTVVFGRLAGISSENVPYSLFALTGFVVWTYFSTAVLRGSEVLAENPQLVTKVYFPRLAAPAAAVLPPLVDLAVSIALVVPLMAYHRVTPTWRVAATPIWVGLAILAAVGVALWLAALNVRFRDVRYALGPVMQMWLFASPVAYPSTLLTGRGELLYAVNPISGVIGLARWSLLGTPWPGWPLAVSTASISLSLWGGIAYFRRAERTFADVI